MKSSFFTIVVFLFVTIFGISGCSSQTIQPPATPTTSPSTIVPPITSPIVPKVKTDPVSSTVEEMVALVNAGNFAEASEYFSDDAMIYLVGMPPTGMEIYWGKGQFRTFLEECCTGQNFDWELDIKRDDNGVVFAEAKTWMDFTRELGVAPNRFHEVFVVQDGKITLYYSTMTESTLANFKPVLLEAIPELAEVMQPAFDPNETPVNEINVTIANNTCSYEGPMTLEAGAVTVSVDVQDERFNKYALAFLTLAEGKDLVDLMAATYYTPPSWSKLVFLYEFNPGESRTVKMFNVKGGLLYMVCFAKPPDLPIGNAGPFVVKE
jgi:hypothetical protein